MTDKRKTIPSAPIKQLPKERLEQLRNQRLAKAKIKRRGLSYLDLWAIERKERNLCRI